MKIKLISKKNLKKIIKADPHQQIYTTLKYYKPVIKNLYLKRIKIALKLLGDKRYSKMLNIGFGGGVILPELSKHTDYIQGVDVHKNIEMVKEILADQGLTNVNLRWADATALPFADNKFDCVWCMSALEFIQDSEKVIAEIKRVAQDNATIILGFPVTNKITDLFYNLVGFKNKQVHQNDHKILIQQIKRYFKIHTFKKIPGWLPLNYSLFCVIKI